MHVNLTIFTMVLVDSINVHQNLIDDEDDLDQLPYDWFTNLSMKMSENTLDSSSSPRRKQIQAESAITPQSPSILVLGNTKDKKDGCLVQCQWKFCSIKCTSICTLCTSDEHGCYDPYYFCDPRNKGRICWADMGKVASNSFVCFISSIYFYSLHYI